MGILALNGQKVYWILNLEDLVLICLFERLDRRTVVSMAIILVAAVTTSSVHV